MLAGPNRLARARFSCKCIAVDTDISGDSPWRHSWRQTYRRVTEAESPLEALGTLPFGAPVGDSPRRLQPLRDDLGVLSARSCPVARLSLGRRWNHGHLRPTSARLLCVGLLERPRSDSQRTPIWPHRQ